MKKTSILLLLVMMAATYATAVAQEEFKPKKGYDITVTIDGYKDSMLLLGNYYVGQTLAMDTAWRDRKGNYTFKKKDRYLMPGLYFFSDTTGNYAEFVVYHEDMKGVKFHTDSKNWTANMTVKGSLQNETMMEYQHALADMYADGKKPTHRAVDSLKEDFIKSHPENMLSKMMNATRPVAVPFVNDKGDSLSNYERYQYYVDHYWDNMPLEDDFLARTPKAIFVNAVKEYMDKTLANAMPSYIIPHLDSTLVRAKKSQEVFKYMVHTFTDYYLQSHVMVYDEVYVHMIQRYYATGEATWASPSTISEQVTRANKWEKILVGKVAPELILKDTLGYAYSLHRMHNKLKLLAFWSPTCGHCKTTIPAINEKMQQLRKEGFDVAAFAILTEPDENTIPQWKKFIDQHNLHDGWIHLNGGEANVDWREVYDVTSTPQLFLLDENNKIIAKKLTPEIFEMAVRGSKE